MKFLQVLLVLLLIGFTLVEAIQPKQRALSYPNQNTASHLVHHHRQLSLPDLTRHNTKTFSPRLSSQLGQPVIETLPDDEDVFLYLDGRRESFQNLFQPEKKPKMISHSLLAVQSVSSKSNSLTEHVNETLEQLKKAEKRLFLDARNREWQRNVRQWQALYEHALNKLERAREMRRAI